jgi:hypothetical protein
MESRVPVHPLLGFMEIAHQVKEYRAIALRVSVCMVQAHQIREYTALEKLAYKEWELPVMGYTGRLLQGGPEWVVPVPHMEYGEIVQAD